MSFVWIAIGILLIALAFIGCFVQKFPGPLAAFVGILIANFGADLNISASALIICALAVVLSMVLNRFLPKITARIHEFGKAGKWGSVIGSVIGVIVLLWGGSEVDSLGAVIAFILLGLGVIPFAFCYLFELISRKNVQAALMPATAAYVTFLCGTLIKLTVCIYCVYAVIGYGFID